MDDTIDHVKSMEQLEIENLHRALDRNHSRPIERSTIHYTQIAEADERWPLFREWNFYRREVGRLIEEGREGYWVLIKGEEILGFWDTWEDVNSYLRNHCIDESILLKQVLTHEPLFRIGYNRLLWPN